MDFHAETEFDRRVHADSPYWDVMYQALLDQLANYVDLAVTEALAAYGLLPGQKAIASARASETAPFESRAGESRDRVHHSPPDQPSHRSFSAASAQTAMVPPWLQPFTLPEKVRFTRTPDAVLRTERPAPQEPRRQPIEEVETAAFSGIPPFDPDLPAWRRPFTLPPNVRINRSPERRVFEEEISAKAGETFPEGETQAAPVDQTPAAPGALFDDDTAAGLKIAVHVSDEPRNAGTVPAWFGMIRAERTQFLRQADEQDNARVGIEALEPSDGEFTDDIIATAWLMSQDERPSPGPALDRREQGIDADRHLAPQSSVGHTSGQEHAPSSSPDAVSLRPGSPGADSDGQRAETSLDAPATRCLDDVGPAVPLEARLPERPIGIASPEDARAFIAPRRGGAARRGGATPQELRPFEQANRVKTDPALWEDPPLELLVEPPPTSAGEELSSGALEQNARLLEGVLEEFGIRGEIIDVRPGPVVTLYELEPAPGTKSSRVIGLSDDIARSMSAVSARVAVVQGRNVIGIELPNQRRETVFLRGLLASDDFGGSKLKLPIALGKTIGGEPIIVDLARMPHLLVAGTTGSGKSVAINTMILSLLYRLKPEECRLIMIDPKMLELSVYEGIPHLLTPVVTDPKKAVVALKWAVREMEDRYKKMSKVGVRNIDGFNARVADAAAKGEVITRTVQTGFNRETGESILETEAMELAPLPYIVVIVDEMADLMMVAGKDIEGAIQRLAQMARAAGIHIIMATQRPSVDVITGTIKANFPTRISFQVTSKIDSRTILGEQGAEQLLGQGDMLYMAGGGRISRVHGPFVSDGEVEKVVAHLKLQGHPDYLDVVVAEEESGDQKAEMPDEKPMFERGAVGDEDTELYEQAVKVVLRDKKCSTSYIQRRLQVGYNKAASLVERMEKEGLVGQANNAGKREILVYSRDLRFTESRDGEE